MEDRMFIARWADGDSNGHMRNTAFLDYAAETRLLYFAEHGFSLQQFAAEGVGPVAMRDDLQYRKEIRMHERFFVNFLFTALNEDGSKFRMTNEFKREDGTLAATVTSDGIWFDIRGRKRTPPPAALADIIRTLPSQQVAA